MYIEFTKLKLQNFMSVGNEPLEISFERGIHFITGYNKDANSRNGVGKTTILAGLMYAIYGETDRTLLKASIPHRGNTDTTITELEFKIGEDHYRILRTLRPNKVFLYINGEDKTRTAPELNKDIIQIIGNTSQDLMEKTIVMSSNSSIPFLAIPKKNDKIEFINGILSLNHFSSMLDAARKRYNANDKVLTGENATNETLKTTLASQKESYKQFEETRKGDIISATNEKADILEEIEKLKKDIAIDSVQLEKDKEQIHEKGNNEISRVKKEISDNNSRIPGLKDNIIKETEATEKDCKEVEEKRSAVLEKIKVFEEKEEKARQIEKKLDGKKTELESEIRSIDKEIGKLKNTPTHCPTCKQELANCNMEHLKNEQERLEGEKKGWEEKIKENAVEKSEFLVKWNKLQELKSGSKAELNNLEKSISDLRKTSASVVKTVQGQIDKIISENETLQRRISEITESVKKDINIIDQKIKSVQGIEESIRTKTNLCNAKDQEIEKIGKRENPFKATIIGIREEILKSDKKISDLNRMNLILDHVKFVVSPEGLKAYIIKKIIKLFNQKLDYYLKRMNSQYGCIFDEMFEEKIFDASGTEIDYNTLSGGERKRMDVAILFTFRDIRKHQTGIAFNVSIFDEIFDSAICSAGMDQIISILQDQEKNNNESIYIITHRKENMEYDGVKVIELVKENGSTKMV